MFRGSGNPLNHVVQHEIVQVGKGGFPDGLWGFTFLSNHIIMQLIAAALLIYFLPRFVRRRAGQDEIGRLVPRGWGNAIEGLCQALRTHVARPALGEHTDRFVPYIWSGNLWITGALAISTLFMIVYNGLRIHGMAYVKHFFMGPPGLNAFIALLEMMGLVFKTFALAMRLFANMIAGHILLAILLSFVGDAASALGTGGAVAISIPVILGSVAINFLELFVAFLQAFIFTFLSAMFIGQAVNIHQGNHEGAPAGAET